MDTPTWRVWLVKGGECVRYAEISILGAHVEDWATGRPETYVWVWMDGRDRMAVAMPLGEVVLADV